MLQEQGTEGQPPGLASEHEDRASMKELCITLLGRQGDAGD